MKDFNGFPKRLEAAIYNKTNKTALAETLGVTRSTVKSWTNGKSSPTAEFLARLCVELEVSDDWLLFGKEQEND